MYEQVNKSNENKSRAAANSVSQKKNGGEQGFGFVDNRLEAVAQRKLQKLNNHRSEPIQRIIETRQSGDRAGLLPTIFVSSFDKTMQVDANNAVITVAATKDDFEGGHAELYLEMYIGGQNVEFSIDMFGVNESRARIRKKRYEMGGVNGRGKGGTTSYQITTDQAIQAIVKTAHLSEEADNGTLMYAYYFPKLWNLNMASDITYMNCADFAAVVLNAAGIAASSGVLSMPKTLAQ